MSNNKKEWSDKQKRLYQRLMTLILYWTSHGYQILRVDLTSSKTSDYSKLRYNYKKLRNKIEYELGYKNIENFIIQTSEGNGVLHMILAWRQPSLTEKKKHFYIDKQWLSDEWSRLHNDSIVVYIKKFDIKADSSRKAVSRYLVSQYLANHKDAIVRYSYSWGRSIGYPINKLWRLFKEHHFQFKRLGRGDLIQRWESFVMGERLEGRAGHMIRIDEAKHILKEYDYI